MRKFFVESNYINEGMIKIIGTDVNHIKNVLRLNVLDKIIICNKDSEQNYICEITSIHNDFVECIILEKLENSVESNVELDIYQGLPKFDKMELVIQKGTELGVSNFIPVKFERCIVKLDSKDEVKKIERWKKIAEVAAKQSGRNKIPQIHKVIDVSELKEVIKNYDALFVAYELEEKNYLKNELIKLKSKIDKNYKIGVIIGPEGGIDIKEAEILKDAGAKIISLGKRILRTETVCLQVSSIIMYELEE